MRSNRDAQPALKRSNVPKTATVLEDADLKGNFVVCGKDEVRVFVPELVSKQLGVLNNLALNYGDVQDTPLERIEAGTMHMIVDFYSNPESVSKLSQMVNNGRATAMVPVYLAANFLDAPLLLEHAAKCLAQMTRKAKLVMMDVRAPLDFDLFESADGSSAHDVLFDAMAFVLDVRTALKTVSGVEWKLQVNVMEELAKLESDLRMVRAEWVGPDRPATTSDRKMRALTDAEGVAFVSQEHKRFDPPPHGYIFVVEIRSLNDAQASDSDKKGQAKSVCEAYITKSLLAETNTALIFVNMPDSDQAVWNQRERLMGGDVGHVTGLALMCWSLNLFSGGASTAESRKTFAELFYRKLNAALSGFKDWSTSRTLYTAIQQSSSVVHMKGLTLIPNPNGQITPMFWANYLGINNGRGPPFKF